MDLIKAEEQLRRRGIDISVQAHDGQTALHVVSQPEIAGALLNAGASLSQTNTFNFTPLPTAASKGNSGVANLLIERGVDIEDDSEANRGGLHPVLKLLFEQGAANT
ncbi:hypothetical protein B0T25DRAFT_565293 [Lasiosphaeria hispida]|uniref:Ankyrin n=1 Tax=Lasiosphaeria hispida TaxID=260671 RepID=A0AAJ0MIJ3_9PEZI|nr:hypothetical protein B0T25DRAFT_565293 [Lasiosphaeria hispida]